MSRKAEVELTFLEHVQELKSRFTWVLLSLIAGSILGYFLRDYILRFLLLSRSEPLFFTSPTGGLDFVIKICLLFGLLVSLPVLLYQILTFLQPVLPDHTKRFAVEMLAASFGLMGIGMAFAYLVSLPAALHFLAEFSTDQIKSLISTDEYLSFVIIYLVGFGVLFQLPLVMWVINKVTKLDTHKLMSWERYVILISFVVAAILTPTPDFVNQTIMAVPMIALYQVSICLIWLANWRQQKPSKLSATRAITCKLSR
jgi:sec-independent protein translocase protein TatC